MIIDFSLGGNSFLVLLLPNTTWLKVLTSVNSVTVLCCILQNQTFGTQFTLGLV